MKALAGFVMKGWPQATGVALLTALLSPLFAPLSLVSGAVVALVALRNGAAEGLRVAAVASAGTAVAAMLFGQLTVGVLFALLLWVPMLVLGIVLRDTRSLPLAVEVAVGFGALVVVFYLLRFDDPAREWAGILETMLSGLLDAQQLDAADRQALTEAMGRWMTGALAAAFFLQTVAALLLARWWQALLYNPGGFREEFHALRLHRWLAIVALPLVAALFVEGLPDILRYVALPVVAAFFLQGLALTHAQIAAFSANVGWLVGVYALLILAPPYAVTALATAGYADAWMDFRHRGENKPGGQAGS
jgi:hypothetical protein